MPGEDALNEAIDELYSIDPDQFTKRRNALAAEARKAGDASAAKSIAELRRPTKAAGIVNRLAREQPDVVAGLAEMSADLRKAQHSLDGARLRELTQQRRKLIDAATRKAFQLGELTEPAAALRLEVASTFEAALADPDVAEQVTAGTLVRSAEWSGFGDSVPTLSAVPSPPSPQRGAKAPAKQSKGRATTASKPADTDKSDTAEQRRQRRVDAAQEVLDAAGAELASAEEAEQERAEAVRLLSEQLADARRRLDEARLGLRRARNRHREAEHKLGRAKR